MITDFKIFESNNKFNIGDVIVRPGDKNIFFIYNINYNDYGVDYDVIKLGSFEYSTFFKNNLLISNKSYPINNDERLITSNEFKFIYDEYKKYHKRDSENMINRIRYISKVDFTQNKNWKKYDMEDNMKKYKI